MMDKVAVSGLTAAGGEVRLVAKASTSEAAQLELIRRHPDVRPESIRVIPLTRRVQV
jgi:hypothetical protein